MDKILEKIVRILKFDFDLYEELNDDSNALSTSIAVILIASLCAGLGTITKMGILNVLVVSIGAFINWMIWIYIVYILGSSSSEKIQDKVVSQLDFVKLIGLSCAPGIIRVFGIINPLYNIVNFVSYVWMGASMVTAVKYIFGFESEWPALKICFFSWLLMLGSALILGSAAKAIGF